MPFLSITSNQQLNCDAGELELLSTAVAEGLQKPESYVMISIQHNPDMLFSGNNQPLAFCELKSLGLTESQTAELSGLLCNTIHQIFDIQQSRIYIEFSAPARPMWGWDGKTF